MSGKREAIPDAWRVLSVDGRDYRYASLAALAEATGCEVAALPVSLKVLLENLLRHAGSGSVGAADLRAVADWTRLRQPGDEVAFHPARILMPDSSGIPLLADLAAMRDAMARLGGDPRRVNPVIPLDLIVDHTVAIDVAGVPDAARRNLRLEYERNRERYGFLRWAEGAFDRLRVVPPGNGICHQVNLESLARVVCAAEGPDGPVAFAEAIVGMDSHTPMINSLGVLGWGIGGIEAATAMLGQPISLQVPAVVGCRLLGRLRPGVTTTDLVLTVTQRMRERGVVGAFVEFCGPGVGTLALAERATVSNMCPEYGATVAMFPIDGETLRYLSLTGRDAHSIALVEAYARAQGLWHDPAGPEPAFSDVVEIDLGSVEPSAAGPRRPQDRLALADVPASFAKALGARADAAAALVSAPAAVPAVVDRPAAHGDVVIAAITSCTNTSNPAVMMAAGLLARNAVALGLSRKPWVKASLAPGSQVVADYLRAAGLQDALDALGFHVAGFGCTTCMGNSGPLPEALAREIDESDLVVTAVLSGNRNFESRIHPQVRTNYLVSPPLVVAYAIAGTVRVDLTREPLGVGRDGRPVFLRDLWPDAAELESTIARHVTTSAFVGRYGRGFASPEWSALPAGEGLRYRWSESSTFIRRPPFFDDAGRDAPPVTDIRGARPLAILGDSVTTDHISPIGKFPAATPAGRYLESLGIAPAEFGSYMERRVNHDVMVRGTFANLQLRNLMAPGSEGGITRHLPDGATVPIHDAALRYAAEGVPLVVVAGAEYGAGSSRDWAAKGTRLLGVRAVIAESFERIHRSNLIGMGVLPVQLPAGVTRASLALDGSERFDLIGLERGLAPRMQLACVIRRADGRCDEIGVRARLDTPREVDWYRQGGMLLQSLRGLL